MTRQSANVDEIRNDRRDRAIVFVHGFSGRQNDTWDRFPGLVGTGVADWDIFTIGYATTLLPDIVGIWSADPDLPILATMLRTQLGLAPFDRYNALALIAHSMGGLIVQKALVDDAGIAARVHDVILFGTPSAGLEKAKWVAPWKRQLMNMASGSDFLTRLRQDWSRAYGVRPPFKFLAVAGASDQFVPPSSSLEPFDAAFQRVVAGDHLSIVKPESSDAPSVVLVVATLRADVQASTPSQKQIGAEPSPVAAVGVGPADAVERAMTVKQIVAQALALDNEGKRDESIALLERNKDRDTDIKGTLGGRMKRMWLETDDQAYGQRALALYQEALHDATTPDQVYYLAINVAFMKLAFAKDRPGAQEMARRALEVASPPGDDVWKTATVAEAYLYLDRKADAIAEYRRLLTLKPDKWKHRSTSLQAARIAAAYKDRELADALESIFTPDVDRVNRIFVSYSHQDVEWLNRLKTMVKPYLHAAETELDLWDDTRLTAGQQWDKEIARALADAGVAVALVSANFLASDYVIDKELPVMVDAARHGDLALLWVYVSAAGYEETPLREFQATHDLKMPLDARPKPEQDQILKHVAEQIKAAALKATGQFTRRAD